MVQRSSTEQHGSVNDWWMWWNKSSNHPLFVNYSTRGVVLRFSSVSEKDILPQLDCAKEHFQTFGLFWPRYMCLINWKVFFHFFIEHELQSHECSTGNVWDLAGIGVYSKELHVLFKPRAPPERWLAKAAYLSHHAVVIVVIIIIYSIDII